MLSQEQSENIKLQLLKQIENLPEEQRQGLKEQIENATSEQIEAFISQEQECLFCGIGKGKTETFKIYEDDTVLAFLDITPSVAGQTIIIPKEHYQFIFQLPDNVLWNISRVIKLLMPLIVNATQSQGVSIYVAQGPAAGQRVAHLAINIIPRFEKDKAVFAWERSEVHKDEIEKVAKEIKTSVTKIISEEKAKIEKKVREEMKNIPKKDEKLEEYPRRI